MRPLSGAAFVIWGLAATALIAGSIWFFRAGVDEEGHRRAAGPVALVAFAVLASIFGVFAFFARSGAVAQTDELAIPPPAELTTTLSPVPTAPDAPQIALSPSAEPESHPVDIGFEEIGAVAVGKSMTTIEQAFGEPSGVVETVASDGKAAKAYTYEGRRAFTIYVRDGKVHSYAVMSSNFITFSGVKIGDGLEKVKEAYGSRLKQESETVYGLAGPRSSSLRIEFTDGKVSRIEGGLLG